MKHYLILAAIFYSMNMFSQVVSFNNPSLENYLLNNRSTNIVFGEEVPYSYATSFIDTNGNGLIEYSEVQNISEIYIENVQFDANFTGLEQFPNLTTLVIEIETNSLDFTNLPNLVTLEALVYGLNSTLTINSNMLHSIKLSGDKVSRFEIGNLVFLPSSVLEDVEISKYHGNPTTININDLSSLKNLDLTSTNINNINTSNNLGLESLKIINRSFYTIQTDLTNNLLLKTVKSPAVGFDFNSLNTLLNLEYLDLSESIINGPVDNITTLNFSNQTELKELKLSVISSLNSIDISSNPNLEKLELNRTDLTSLDLSNNLMLNSLAIEENPNFQNLNIFSNTDLIRLRLFLVNLSNVDFSQNVNLVSLSLLYFNSDPNLNIDHLNQLQYFSIGGFESIANINLTNNLLLNNLWLRGGMPLLNNIDVSSNLLLEQLHLYNVEMTDLDLTMNPLLRRITVDQSNFTSLNLNDKMNITQFNITNNPFLTEIFLKNFTFDFNVLSNNPNLNFICTDPENITLVENLVNDTSVVVNSYCSFNPGGDFKEVTGTINIDTDLNACDINDPVFPRFTLGVTDGTDSGTVTADASGNYYLPVADGQHTITPQPENPTYWNFSPASITVDFPTQSSPFTQDFCVTANGSVEDLEVVIIPLEEARPGFETDYAVQIKNKGNQTASGSLSLLFEDDFMTYGTSDPMASVVNDELSWPFSNLEPFQSERFTFSMTMNVPNGTAFPLVGGEILNFTATVTGTGTDAMPLDNTMTLQQEVVNSFDPNDKRCLEGKTILPSMVGEYVHYMIRFENTGTASAVNIVVKDEIDTTRFDMSTFVPLGGSHDYYVRTVGDGNTVEFIHENIFLDFDDATNDGFVLFKIKTLPTLVEGDTFSNDAEIFFDFNAPIVTNNETTTVNSTASIGSVEDVSIKVYPNPSNGIVNLSASSSIESVTVIDVQGRQLSRTNFVSRDLVQNIDLSGNGSGIYFLKVQSEVGVSVFKVVVE
jgi:hypothetical protein